MSYKIVLLLLLMSLFFGVAYQATQDVEPQAVSTPTETRYPQGTPVDVGKYYPQGTPVPVFKKMLPFHNKVHKK